jgi:hypothetical protein
MRMINKFESGQSLSAIACELDFEVSFVNTIGKDAAHMKEYVKGMVLMKSVLIAKKHESVLSEIVKLLMMWMAAQIQKCVPRSLMPVQTEAGTK